MLSYRNRAEFVKLFAKIVCEFWCPNKYAISKYINLLNFFFFHWICLIKCFAKSEFQCWIHLKQDSTEICRVFRHFINSEDVESYYLQAISKKYSSDIFVFLQCCVWARGINFGAQIFLSFSFFTFFFV